MSMRSYAAGYDATIKGIGGCPFDMNILQQNYVEGAITPTRIIHFAGLTTSVNISVSAMDNVPNSDGKDSIDLLAGSSFFESSVLNFRLPNLHKPGSARASDFWGVIPTNKVSPQLIQKLHQGGVDRIVVSALALIDGGTAGDKARVVQTVEYTSCFLKMVDMTSYGFLTLFAFSFVKMKITQHDVKPLSASGANTADHGVYVYEFNYNSGEGKGS